MLRLANTLVLVSALFVGLPANGAAAAETPLPGMDKEDMSVSPACASMKCENPAAICCGGEPCVDIMASTENCGACGKTCRTKESATTANCIVPSAADGPQPAAPMRRAVAMAATMSLPDASNCGGCGVARKSGRIRRKRASARTFGHCLQDQPGLLRIGVQRQPERRGQLRHVRQDICKAGKACKTVCAKASASAASRARPAAMASASTPQRSGKLRSLRQRLQDLFGIPLPCILTVCTGMKFDMGTDM